VTGGLAPGHEWVPLRGMVHCFWVATLTRRSRRASAGRARTCSTTTSELRRSAWRRTGVLFDSCTGPRGRRGSRFFDQDSGGGRKPAPIPLVRDTVSDTTHHREVDTCARLARTVCPREITSDSRSASRHGLSNVISRGPIVGSRLFSTCLRTFASPVSNSARGSSSGTATAARSCRTAVLMPASSSIATPLRRRAGPSRGSATRRAVPPRATTAQCVAPARREGYACPRYLFLPLPFPPPPPPPEPGASS